MIAITALLFAVLVAGSSAELPAANRAPYAASGWRPNRAFNLPGEYLPPLELEPQQRPQQRQQQQSRPRAYDIEFRKERIDFAGQVQDSALVHRNEPQNAYLPPLAEDDYQRQDLPQLLSPPQQQFLPQPAVQPERKGRPVQFGAPSAPPTSAAPQQFGARIVPRPATQQQTHFPRPSQEYGAPEVDEDLPEPRHLQADVSEVNEEQQENRGAIQALNAAVEAYNRNEATRNIGEEQADEQDVGLEDGYPSSTQNGGSRFTKGQYYVLGPDNKVQRVMFTTSQDEQDTRNNGFTAQLKYTPVGEVRDPVFKYNNQGQLVRLFRK